MVLVAACALLAGCGDDEGKSCVDNDGDGAGPGCAVPVDCDDNNPNAHPNATETCNTIDDNCDGVVDELAECAACTDEDNDGFVGGAGCAAADDCNDGDRSVFPGATEVCNQIDDNCDGTVDEGDACAGACVDADSDGYGVNCAAGADCNDDDAAINPAARETCNTVDDNCDGTADEGDVCSTTCVDADSDSYGAGCAAGADCNDDDPAINPAATEACDSVDNDCNDQVDENDVCGGCVDLDNDGTSPQSASCPTGTDCNDDDDTMSPNLPELPRNQVDDNCDGDVDEAIDSPLLGDVLVNEILIDGATNQDANGDGDINSTDDEFIELVNASGAAVDMAGWTLWDSGQTSARHTFPAGTSVPAGDVIVVFGGGNAPDAVTGAQFQTAVNDDPGLPFGLSLNNAGDTVTLYDAQFREVFVFSYGDQGGAVAVQDESLTRNPDVTGAFVAHTTASGDVGVIFSPGAKVDGSSF